MTFVLQLLDLCMMDIDWLGYSYSVLAAAAFCHFSTFEVVHKVSGESDLVLIVTDVWRLEVALTLCVRQA